MTGFEDSRFSINLSLGIRNWVHNILFLCFGARLHLNKLPAEYPRDVNSD